MAEINITAKLTWYSGDGKRVCDVCQRFVEGKFYHPLMQFREIEKLDFTDLKPVLCAACYLQYKENL